MHIIRGGIAVAMPPEHPGNMHREGKGISVKDYRVLLIFLILVITMACGMTACSMMNDADYSDQLKENKIFITETFDAIGENPQVMLSSTADIAKTAEPELYNAMLSQGDALLPAVLSLLEESEHGRRGAELYMLYKDIQESLGEPVLDYEQLTAHLTEDSQ